MTDADFARAFAMLDGQIRRLQELRLQNQELLQTLQYARDLVAQCHALTNRAEAQHG